MRISTEMKWAGPAAAALLLGGCGGSGDARNVDAVIEAKLEAGAALLTCRASSSGTCHALFITEASFVTAEAGQGEVAGAQGLGPGTRYCVDVVAPDPAQCRPRPLLEGEQIVRSATVRS